MKIQLKRSNVLSSGAAKVPTASQLEYGELAVNYNTSDPAIFLKDSNNNVIRISGVGNISDDGLANVPDGTTPPANPEAGNLWFNSDQGRLYIYFTDADSSQWVDASPDSWDPSSYPDLTNSSAQSNTLDDRYAMLNGGNSFTGNVGVGTSSPSTKLNIRSNASDDGILLEKNDGTDVARLFYDGTTDDARLTMFSGGATKIRLRANGDSHFSGGNVGIGTASPYTVSAASNSLNIANTSSSAEINFLSSTTGFNALYFGDGSSGTDRYRGYLEYAHNGDYMRFATATTERMRIDSAGKVGIGVTPVEALHVKTAGSTIARIESGTNTGVSSIYFADPSSASAGWLQYEHTNDALSVGASNGEKLRVDSSGRLLVGTSSEAGNAKLIVRGGTGTNVGVLDIQANINSTAHKWERAHV